MNQNERCQSKFSNEKVIFVCVVLQYACMKPNHTTPQKVMVWSWSGHGQVMVMSWSCHGQVMVRSRSGQGQVMVKSWPGHGQVMVRS